MSAYSNIDVNFNYNDNFDYCNQDCFDNENSYENENINVCDVNENSYNENYDNEDYDNENYNFNYNEDKKTIYINKELKDFCIKEFYITLDDEYKDYKKFEKDIIKQLKNNCVKYVSNYGYVRCGYYGETTSSIADIYEKLSDLIENSIGYKDINDFLIGIAHNSHLYNKSCLSKRTTRYVGATRKVKIKQKEYTQNQATINNSIPVDSQATNATSENCNISRKEQEQNINNKTKKYNIKTMIYGVHNGKRYAQTLNNIFIEKCGDRALIVKNSRGRILAKLYNYNITYNDKNKLYEYKSKADDGTYYNMSFEENIFILDYIKKEEVKQDKKQIKRTKNKKKKAKKYSIKNNILQLKINFNSFLKRSLLKMAACL